ncbi:MAG: protein kinase [Sphingomonadales bacterium]
MDSEHFHALPKGYRFDDFEIVRVLGQGGFGITYLGYHHDLDKPVAIKEYLPGDLAVRDNTDSVVPKAASMAEDFREGLDSFLDEARTLARFKHHSIIQVHHFFRANGTAYIVMEFAEGEDLSILLKRQEKLPEDELVAILGPIIEGLALVHKAGILHRDIKPQNIMIRDDGSPVLIDFGAARQAIGAMSRSITAIVTPGYAPIEQYSSRGNQGPWTDIYALGAVAYKCLTGKSPPDATERVTDDEYIPVAEALGARHAKSLHLAIDAALEKRLKDRPQDLTAWKAMLEGDKKVEIKTPPEPTAEEPVKPPREPEPEPEPEREKPPPPAEPKPDPDSGPEPGSRRGLYVGLAVAFLMVVGGIASYLSWTRPTEPGSGTPSTPGAETADPASMIEQAQGLFNLLGYKVGPPDGVMTPRTEGAVRKFEKDQGLIEVGVIDNLLIQELKAELARRDEAAWQAAKAAGTEAALEDYRKAYPGGRYVAKADDEITRLRAAAKRKAEAEKKKAEQDDRAWAAAKAADSVASYRGYLKARPTGRHAAEARRALELVKATAVAAGFRHTCALQAGGVLCWGDNVFGQSDVPALARTGVTAIAAGGHHTCALKGGGVLCWGENDEGQNDVPRLARLGVTAIAAGWSHGCALKGGGVLCWGWNENDQITVPSLARSGVSAIAAGDWHSCALKAGRVLCWGYNEFGQSDIPSLAQSGVSAIAAGFMHSCALKAGGIALLCWGSNKYGQNDVPTGARSGVSAIAAGGYHSCALKAGGVLCWGWNGNGQSDVPAAARSGVSAISAGGNHSCALKAGGVLCWGLSVGEVPAEIRAPD